ncbi:MULTISPECIES: LysR family transcriptional regulator [unclassified Cryobacterium]|uniref:LysR family transcriptional regulator n=1 Tax=unclassified Cryobacterium TaxID=2649013 RepID=UPI00106AE0FE|nr:MULTISPECIES: LysR family transcriptional regulator [Cryobacterium]MDY7529527.1 LysR family transcriptional regulator [Cryobacterium sp. 10C2]MDY7558332.1 LysR family transcriptional regulator [Cryobacterium sp. 10C3]MEB0002367.1 LysR family transcriptional regulator [Cryobacterium sp. RTC2.1]MEB0200879.1 LysR family transcriptional regulator [Cryobacterium sp. 5I3]MEB0285421.1 LysR family transcriptional regulator [Cryobacterium sp. 10S3]
MLDVRRLRLLRELKIRGTLAGVAEALSYSPSAVSQQLALLEKEAGVELLHKVGRRVQLTAQAEILVDHTTHLLERLEIAEAEMMASLTTVSGTVRVAVFQSASHAVIPRALTLLAAEFPQLRVEVTEREPERGLFEVSARDFDLVLAEQYPGHGRAHRADLDRVNLATDALRLALPSASASADLAGLARMPWVMEPEGTVSRSWASQLCREAGFEPDVRFETADLIAHIRLIESGNAVGILPDLVWAGAEPTVRLVDLPGHPRRTLFSAARRSSTKRPGVVAVRDALARAVTP